MEDFSMLIKFCQENICNVSKLKETCKKVHDKKSIFGNNNDKNKIFDMCDKILNDPKYDNDIISEPLTEKQEQFMVHLEFQLSEQIGKVRAYTINFESSKKTFLNMKMEGMEGLEYPFARIIAAEGYPNIEMTTGDALNRTYFRDFLRTYYDIDYDNTEGISYNQLKTIIIATKIE
ncbi:18596_t:CDS:1 [Racocetra persica]|uniref:18596_t:CDS:1 n=1 Tax=Racocetra persica TaxID=160502 RepID=A0ACA9SBU0_9GLOM|nr:18596_t:CDS:1 [Racocetra persica]